MKITIGDKESLDTPAVTAESDHRTCSVVVELEQYDMMLRTKLSRTNARALIGALELAIADLSGAELTSSEAERRQQLGDPMGLGIEK